MSLITSALHYAKNGIPVFPVHGINDKGNCTCTCLDPTCAHPGKHPIFKEGFESATTDEQEITAWWEHSPKANIGVPTGALSGWYVVDIDEKKQHIDCYKNFSEQHNLPSAIFKVRTGSGGCHLIYGQPDTGQAVGSSTHIGKLQGVNFRGDGGYIVVPPSKHYSRNDYRWITGFTFNDHNDLKYLRPLPAIIADLVNNPVLRAIQKNQNLVEKGGRNDYLFQQACLYRKNGIADTELLDAVWAENQRVCDPLLEMAEVEKLVINALNMDISHQQSNIVTHIPSNEKNQSITSGYIQSKDKSKKDDPFDRLIKLTTNHEFWLDEGKKAFVTFPIANANDPTNQSIGQAVSYHYENWPIKSSEYRQFLRYQYRQCYMKNVSPKILEDVVDVLAGETLFCGSTYKTYIRTARYQNDCIFIDLTDNNWSYVKISASAWSVFSHKPPVKFLRTNNCPASTILSG